MCRDASALPCVLLGDSRETDPLACLQPLIAITPQWKQSIHPPTTPNLSLSLSLPPSLSLQLPDHLTFLLMFPPSLFFQFASLSIYVAKKKRCHISWGSMWSVGVVVLTNVLLEKDDLLWLRVADWSCGALFIHLRPPAAAAAAFTSGCSPLPSPCSPSGLASAAAPLPGPGPWVVAAMGSAGVEKEAAASSIPYRVTEGRGMWLKTDIPCCLTLWVMELGPLECLQDWTLTLAH